MSASKIIETFWCLHSSMSVEQCVCLQSYWQTKWYVSLTPYLQDTSAMLQFYELQFSDNNVHLPNELLLYIITP